jgi:type I restriction enzyme S subunit
MRSSVKAVQLGKVLAFSRGITWSHGQERRSPGPNRYPVIRIPNLQTRLNLDDILFLEVPRGGRFSDCVTRKGDILLVGSNGNPARVGNAIQIEAEENFLFASFLIAGRLRDPGTHSQRFVFHVFTSPEIQSRIAKSVQGTTGLSNLSLRFLDSLPFPDFAIKEQRRIAKILDTAGEAIEKTESTIEKLKMMRIGVMHELFTRGLDKNGKMRPGASEAPKNYSDTKIGLVPRDWSADPLSKNCETYSGGTPARGVSQYYGGGIPWVKSGEVNLDTILSTEESLSEKGLAASNAKWIPAGTPLIAMYGATAGKVSWLAIKATANQAVLAIVPRSEKIHARYVLWAMRFAAPRLIALATGSGQPNLSKGIIDSLLLPLPEDPKEQIAIAEALDTVTSRIITEQMNLDKLKNLKAGLMNDLLTGKVSVRGTTAQYHHLGQLPFADRGAA